MQKVKQNICQALHENEWNHNIAKFSYFQKRCIMLQCSHFPCPCIWGLRVVFVTADLISVPQSGLKYLSVLPTSQFTSPRVLLCTAVKTKPILCFKTCLFAWHLRKFGTGRKGSWINLNYWRRDCFTEIVGLEEDVVTLFELYRLFLPKCWGIQDRHSSIVLAEKH